MSHSVRNHLRLEIDSYDKTIRQFIPGYEEGLTWAAREIVGIRPTLVLDLGAGTGALAEAMLEHEGVGVVEAIDVDAEMLDRARIRLKRFGVRARFQRCSFESPLPECDAVSACLALHHVPTMGQVLIFLSNLRMVPRARLSCWFLRRAFGEELVSKFLDSPDCENIHPYAAPFTRCGQQDCEREFYRGLLGKEVRNDFRPTFEFSEGALE